MSSPDSRTGLPKRPAGSARPVGRRNPTYNRFCNFPRPWCPTRPTCQPFLSPLLWSRSNPAAFSPTPLPDNRLRELWASIWRCTSRLSHARHAMQYVPNGALSAHTWSFRRPMTCRNPVADTAMDSWAGLVIKEQPWRQARRSNGLYCGIELSYVLGGRIIAAICPVPRRPTKLAESGAYSGSKVTKLRAHAEWRTLYA